MSRVMMPRLSSGFEARHGGRRCHLVLRRAVQELHRSLIHPISVVLFRSCCDLSSRYRRMQHLGIPALTWLLSWSSLAAVLSTARRTRFLAMDVCGKLSCLLLSHLFVCPAPLHDGPGRASNVTMILTSVYLSVICYSYTPITRIPLTSLPSQG